jgi:ATPase subunit of ABC transporter with duplicated ATPase domains
VLVSHDRSFVSNLGTKFLVIHKKKLIEIDDPQIFYDYMTKGTPLIPNAEKKTG